MDYFKWLSDLGDGNADPTLVAPQSIAHEVFINTKTGEPQQAGADQSDGKWIRDKRREMEQSLFAFGKGIIGFSRLSTSLHLEVCNWLQRIPPYRKLYLLPRDHLKTSIARALILHLLIQPQEDNCYFPGCRELVCPKQLDCEDPNHRFAGRETRIVYCGETDDNAVKQLSWVMATAESNTLLRGFWPHVFWENPTKQSKKWSAKALQFQRSMIFPEASIEGIGVGGAVTGRHFNVLIKDDIATIKAANSRTEMVKTIEWNRTTRALMDDPDRSLEFMLGTRWAPLDVWETIMVEDPSVDPMIRAIIEDGKPIWPEVFSMETIERLKKEEKSLFPFIRMNSGADPSVVDFLPDELREFRLDGHCIVFDDDSRDLRLQTVMGARQINLPRGTKLTPELLAEIAQSGQRLVIG